jgi:molecular chaperone DnaK
MLEEAERTKIALSTHEEATFRMPFYDGEKSIEYTLTREALESLASPWLQRTPRHCRQALADATLKPEDLHAVVLVGGSTRIPFVRQHVASFFDCNPDISQHPDEAIALGATIQAGVLNGSLRKMVLLDVTPLSLGIETFGGLMNVLIPRNTTIPCKAGEMFTNAADQQKAMLVRILQGEREMAKDNWELGRFDVTFSPSPKGQARMGVQFKIDENGILEVLARDVTTGVDTIVQLGNAAVNVDDAAVESMVSESVEYAFSDMAERIFTEAKLKAEELLPAVASVLEQGLALEHETLEIETATQQVHLALEQHSANALKAAVQRLDSATEALAARLVERAMDEAMDRKLGL